MKRFVCALLSASILSLVGPLSAAAFTPQTVVATRALDWIQQTQLGTDGAVGADATRTEEVIWGLVAHHRPVSAFVKAGSISTPLDYLRANVAKEEATAGNIAQLILAVTAAGEDPTSFGPADAKRNLLDDLQADYHPATGEFGSDKVFNHILSILSIRSANRGVPAAAIAFLKSQQEPDGGWSFDNANAFGTDTNTTALALVALASASELDGCLVGKALAYLKAAQQPSGGFAAQAAFPPSDPDSDGIVIEGLLAVGQDPTGSAWTVAENKNPVTDLISFQGEDGSFSFPGIGADNLLATTQPLVALASTHVPLSPLGTSFAAPTLPTCQQGTATASPSPSPTPVPALPRTGGGASALALLRTVWSAPVYLAGVIALVMGWRWRRRPH